MAAVVNVNGRITDAASAVIPVFDHGFLYGEGVYEVVCTYGDAPFLFDRHMQRLRTSAQLIGLPVPMSDEQFLAETRRTVDALRAQTGWAGDVYVRLLLTRGVGELTYDPAACPTPSLTLIAKPQDRPSPAMVAAGVTIALVSVVRNHPQSLNPLIKSNNLLNNALAMQEALRRGAIEALMLNHSGEIAECSQSNVFLVKDGVAHTPPLGAGLLAGITRGFVFELGESIGVEVRETTLHADDLDAANEVFLSSTTKELLPVVRVDERAVGDGTPGPITRRLREAFARRVSELSGAATRA